MFERELAPGEERRLPALPLHLGPLGVVSSRFGAWSSADPRAQLAIDLPMPGETERRRHWLQCLAPQDAADLAQLASLRLASGNIRRAARSASALAALAQRDPAALADVQRACRELRSARLQMLSTRLDAEGSLDQLAVDGNTREELEVLLVRCRLREQLAAESRGGAAGNQGVRALFAGPSGTGKSWAARLVAASLGKDLYRLDQAAAVSKWLGDTEKALQECFAAAEELDVVLLIDEGDSLMGTRTSISSSNDRHANFQTNALLQILESYQGILLVTTNAADHIDQAFARRMDVVIDFRVPDEWQRLDILRLHLGTAWIADEPLREIAARCALTGGQLRNVVSHARLLALRDGADLGSAHLQAALVREYRKLGDTCPVRFAAGPRG